MRKDAIQELLAKYQQGTISDKELAELSILTRKDEVMEDAFCKADAIIRRRTIRAVSFVMAGLVLIGAGIWFATPGQERQGLTAETNVVTETTAAVEEARQEVPQPAAKEVKDEEAPVLMASASEINRVEAKEEATVVKAEKPAAKRSKKPVVVCNTQCDEDAVINDIWKFLSA